MRPTKPVPKAQRRWVEVNLSGSLFHNVDLTGSRIRGALVDDVELDLLDQMDPDVAGRLVAP